MSIPRPDVEKPKPKRKARRVKPKRDQGFAAPAIDFAEKAARALEDKPPRKARRVQPRARKVGMLDVLPAKPGDKPHAYNPGATPNRKFDRDLRAERDRAVAEREARRAAAAVAALVALKQPDRPKKDKGGLLGAITSAAKAGSELGEKLAPAAVGVVIPGIGAGGKQADKEIRAIGRHGAQDIVDTLANAIPSTYYLAKTAIRDPKAAAEMLAEPYIETARNPVKAFHEHPVNTLLLASGAEGALGRGAGKALRVAPSKTARRIASTKREPIEGPGHIDAEQTRTYSKDLIVKAGQVANDKRKARKARRIGQPAKTMTNKEIARRVDETVSAGRIVAGHRESEAARQAAEAMGRKPTAATSLLAQGITDATAADIRAYLSQLEREARSLSGADLQRNRQARRQIEQALAHHDEAKIRESAQRYSDLAARQEADVLAHGLVTPEIAAATRLAGVKVRKRPANPELKVIRRDANRKVKTAKAAHDQAAAALAQALADARASAARHRGGVAPAQHDRLLAAIDNRDHTAARLNAAKTAAASAQTRYLRAQLPDGAPEPAYVSHAPGGDVRPAAVPVKPPKLAHDTTRAGKAIKRGTIDLSPRRLVEQAADTQRRLAAAANYRGFIDEFAHRDSRGGDKVTFASKRTAENYARKLADRTGTDWQPMRSAPTSKSGQYVLVPHAAATRLAQHAQQTITPGQAFTQAWSRNVLSTSPKWLTGQAVEPGIRAAIAHAGPRSYLTGRRVLKRLDPDTAQQVKARALPGGLPASALRREKVADDHLNGLVATMRKAADKPGPKQAVAAYRAWTDFALGTLNRLVQDPTQTAVFGKALRDSPLMSDRTLKLTTAAIEDAARGLRDTNAQVALGRDVDRIWGNYNKFSPRMRAVIANYTPFAAWTWSAMRFLFDVLPRDHPVMTSMLAAAADATHDWRAQHELVFDPFTTDNQAPGWLQGSIPGKDGSHLVLGRYVPFGLANDDGFVLGGIASTILPQYQGAIQALTEGKDWTGRPLTNDRSTPTARRYTAALSTLVKGVLPAANELVALTGIQTPDRPDSTTTDPNILRRLRKTNDPFMYTRGSTRDGKKLKVSRTRGKLAPLPPITQTLPAMTGTDLPPLTGR